MLTFFTIPKPFTGRFKLIQENAIRSWKRLNPDEIILFGTKKEIKNPADNLGCRQRGVRQHVSLRLPLVSDAFKKAQREATSRLLCFLNTDLILMDDFAEAVALVADRFEGDFLMLGQRFSWKIPKPLDFSADWQKQLWDYSRSGKARLYGRGALDYFVFPRGLYRRMPEFLVGRGRWDLWMSSHVLYRKTVPVVDITRAVLVVHQDHRGHDHTTQEQWRHNERLADREKDVQKGLTSYATWELTKEMELVKRPKVPKKEKFDPWA